MISILLIGLGGFAGAIARCLVDLRISALTGATLPWGMRAILPELDKMLGDGLITLEKVDVMTYRAR